MTRWGSGVLERLPLEGDETVLDAGCGSGRVTEQLLERLPGGRVIAADAAPSMLVEARRRLERFGDRVRFVECDLGEPLTLGPVDAVLSTATFHWVADHDALFRNLAAVLRPGSRLVAQCGGVGNVESVRRVAAELLDDGWGGPWTFATPEETAARLVAAGFADVDTWLQEEPTPVEPGEPLETFLATVILRCHLARMPEREHAGFVRQVAERLLAPEIDYVRLNITARRA
jgi:trans-aconitate 2-methyltransferase